MLSGSGSGYTSWILNALAWCARAGTHVVNLSLGGGASTHDPTVYSAAYERRRPGWHGDTIRVHLWTTALDLGAAGRDPLVGYGLVNADRAVRERHSPISVGDVARP